MIHPLLIAASGTAAIALPAIAYATTHPTCQWFGPVLSRGKSPAPPRVALTFDDGPIPGMTDRVLKILNQHNAPASFFCIGHNVAHAPSLLCELHAAGHLVGNHSYHHHRHGCFHAQTYWRNQLQQTNDAICQAIGLAPRLFRPPMGLKTPRVLRAARNLQMDTVTWTHRGLDTMNRSPKSVVNRLTHRLSGGCILLMHDGAEPGRTRDIDTTIQSLPRVIDAVRSMGLEFARLDELLGIDAYASTR